MACHDQGTALAWLLFYVLRRYVLEEIEPGKYFSLLLSAEGVGLFWTIVYGFSGSYTDVLRKSRLREVANIGYANLWGGLVLIVLLLADDENLLYYKSYLRTAGSYLLINTALAMLAPNISLCASDVTRAQPHLHRTYTSWRPARSARVDDPADGTTPGP